jgi:hypothetical protein
MQVATYPSVLAAAASSVMSAQATSAVTTTHYSPHYAPSQQQYHPTTNAYGSGAWSYHTRYEIPQAHESMPHGYAAFYSQPSYGQSGSTAYQAALGTQVQWQQPYTGGQSQNVQGSNQWDSLENKEIHLFSFASGFPTY